jgi:poly(A) polymerase
MIAQEMQEHKSPDFHAWAMAFTHPQALTCIQAVAARYPVQERLSLLHKLAERHDRLGPHIARLLDKRPLVSAALLQKYGIIPGKQMGVLLKEAERIAIVEHIHDPEVIIGQLKQTPLWVQAGG